MEKTFLLWRDGVTDATGKFSIYHSVNCSRFGVRTTRRCIEFGGTVPSIDRLLLMVRRSRHPKLLRYAAAGGAMSIGYTLTVIFFVNGIKCLNPASASACSFALWTPISYFVHRDFTFLFPVANAQLGTFVKFLISFLARLAAAMYIVRFMTIDLGFPYLAGVFANWIALPVIGYIAMNSWVFRVAEQHPIQVDRGP